MKKIPALPVIFTALFFALQSPASAELISGKIDTLSKSGQELTVTVENPVTQTEETVLITLDETTEYTGAEKGDLKKGGRVLVEASKEDSGRLKASSVNAVQ